MVKAKLKFGTISYQKDGKTIVVTKKSGTVEVPDNVYNKFKHKFEGGNSKPITSGISKKDHEKAVAEAVEKATEGMISVKDHERAVAEAVEASCTETKKEAIIEAINKAADAIGSINNKNKVLEELIKNL